MTVRGDKGAGPGNCRSAETESPARGRAHWALARPEEGWLLTLRTTAGPAVVGSRCGRRSLIPVGLQPAFFGYTIERLAYRPGSALLGAVAVTAWRIIAGLVAPGIGALGVTGAIGVTLAAAVGLRRTRSLGAIAIHL